MMSAPLPRHSTASRQRSSFEELVDNTISIRAFKNRTRPKRKRLCVNKKKVRIEMKRELQNAWKRQASEQAKLQTTSGTA